MKEVNTPAIKKILQIIAFYFVQLTYKGQRENETTFL